MNPRYEDFLNDLREDNLLEDVAGFPKDTADSNEALKVFGDEFVMVAQSGDERFILSETPAASAATPSDAHGSEPPDVEALNHFLDFHDSIRSVYPVQAADAAEEEAASPAKEFALPGLGRQNALIRHQLKKRAVDEVNGLHMIDHVICAAEREQRKIVSHPHDGLHVKQALHDFLQALSTEDLVAISIAETKFIEETEKWLWDLIAKDSKLTVADLRRYCETTKPALSGRALTALARFYRNAPFSYAVREKFELVMTRLYSRETGGDKRKTLFSGDVIAQQIGGLYAEWASLQTYSEEDSFTVVEAERKLRFLMHEAEIATCFEELTSADFFTRLRSFKESLHEEFFSPIVTAAAVECNVTVGNRFIELLEKERKRDSLQAIGDKFPDVCGEDVSEMTGKTIDIAEELCAGKRKAARVARVRPVAPVKKKGAFMKKIRSFFSIGPWLVFVIAIVLISAVAIYFGAQRMIFDADGSSQIKRVNLENSVLKEYVQGATITGETFVGTITPAWDMLEDDQKNEVVNKLLSVGASKGFKYVRLVNVAGKTVASGTPGGASIR